VEGETPAGVLREVSFSEPVYERIFELGRPYLQTRNNDLHTRISYQFALRLLEQGGDPAVVIPAILLHDIGWAWVPEDLQLTAFGPKATNPELRDVHERWGAQRAEEILTSLGYPEEAIRKIIPIIAGHDSKEASDSLEEAIVKDSDKLFRFSAEGVLTILGWQGCAPGFLLERLEERIPRWFLTPLGQELAQQEWEARNRDYSIDR